LKMQESRPGDRWIEDCEQRLASRRGYAARAFNRANKQPSSI
jgi:hypothetical protein